MAMSFEDLNRYSPEVAHQMGFVCAAFVGSVESLYRGNFLEMAQRIAMVEKHFLDVLTSVCAHENTVIVKRVQGIGPSLSPHEMRMRALSQARPNIPQPVQQVLPMAEPIMPGTATNELPTAPPGLPFRAADGLEYVMVKQTLPNGQSLSMLERYDAAKHANVVARAQAELVGEKLHAREEFTPSGALEVVVQKAEPGDATLPPISTQVSVDVDQLAKLLAKVERLESLLSKPEPNAEALLELARSIPPRFIEPKVELKTEPSVFSPPPTIFRCDVCPQVFTTARALETHGVDMHDKPSPFAVQALENLNKVADVGNVNESHQSMAEGEPLKREPSRNEPSTRYTSGPMVGVGGNGAASSSSGPTTAAIGGIGGAGPQSDGRVFSSVHTTPYSPVELPSEPAPAQPPMPSGQAIPPEPAAVERPNGPMGDTNGAGAGGSGGVPS